jgi:multiple sugar transport system ATP-binding protein
MYVAAFVGSPRMNFYSARVHEGVAKASGFSLPLPVRFDAADAVIGLRPEAIGVPGDGREAITMRVEVVEAVGSDQFLHGLVGSDQSVARVDPDFVATPGTDVQLGIDLRRIHLFDPATERSLLPA